MTNRLELIRKVKQEMSSQGKPCCKKKNEFAPLEKGENDPCWEDYVQVGTKIVDGKEVPNCVPMDMVKEGFPVPSPSGSEDEQGFISRCMSEIGSEYDQDQALAICYSKWREK